MPKSIPELSSDTRVIASRLCKLEPGQVISYDELNTLIAGNVRNGKAHNLHSARRVISREHGIATGTVRGVGVKRLMPGELPSIGDEACQRARRTARRGVKRLIEAASKTTMDQTTSTMLHARVSLLGAIAHAGSTSGIKRVEQELANTKSGELPVSRTLALFAAK